MELKRLQGCGSAMPQRTVGREKKEKRKNFG
jgi:hypothetical protein